MEEENEIVHSIGYYWEQQACLLDLQRNVYHKNELQDDIRTSFEKSIKTAKCSTDTKRLKSVLQSNFKILENVISPLLSTQKAHDNILPNLIDNI